MKVHDFVAVGLGPFNLGLACLSDPVPDLDGVFLEASDRFDWHPGMLLDGATLQVPFMADLVTLADPTSRLSFLSFLKQTGRLYSFYIREEFAPLRLEYNKYCQWAADQLDTVRFGRRVVEVTRVEQEGDEAYDVRTHTGEVFRGRRLVLGGGTTPHIPASLTSLVEAAAAAGLPALHSADYLPHRDRLRRSDSITVIGSGQSAAEVYVDLLSGIDEGGYRLDWVTRSPRFFPMEYTKLTLEMTSPEWVDHFHQLPEAERDRLARSQKPLYKGISGDLINQIFDTLYEREVCGGTNTTLLTATEVTRAAMVDGRARLDLWHSEEQCGYALTTDAVVLATGYRPHTADYLAPVEHLISRDAQGRLDVSRRYTVDAARSIFVQNAEEHTHGFVSPDLGMGAYRNSVIIAAMTGREVYPIEKRIAFQQFGIPDHLRTPAHLTPDLEDTGS